MTRNEQMLLATAVLQAIEKHDTRQRMRPRIVDEPAGPRVRIGHSLDSYAYITLEGKVQLSHGVPLRWRGGLRVVLENLGVYAGHTSQIDTLLTSRHIAVARDKKDRED